MSAQFGQDFPAMCPAPYNYQPLGDAQVTVTSTAQTLAQLLATAAGTNGQPVAIPTGSRAVLILVETANVRYTMSNGQSPTTTFGMLLVAGQEFSFSSDLTTVQFIAVSGSPLLDLIFLK